MLVLSRKQNEEIIIGDNVCIKVVGVFGNKVRLGISAPTDVAIRRGELDFFGRTGNRTPEGDLPQILDLDVPSHDKCLLEHA